MKPKKLLVSAGAVSLAAISVLGVFSTSAFADSNSDTKHKAPTAAEIKDHESQRKADMEKRLDEAVTAGTITSDQKDLIVSFFENNKPDLDENSTDVERKAAMDAFKTKVESFAQENNISLDLLRPGKGEGPRGGGAHASPEERKANLEKRLDEAVSAGTITSAQKTLIVEFMDSHKPAKPDENASESERRTALEEQRSALEKFAEENNIDVDVIRPPKGQGPGPEGARINQQRGDNK